MTRFQEHVMAPEACKPRTRVRVQISGQNLIVAPPRLQAEPICSLLLYIIYAQRSVLIERGAGRAVSVRVRGEEPSLCV